MGIFSWLGRLFGGGDDDDAPSPEDLVVVASPHGEPEALMLKEMLENEGVHSMLRNRDGFSARVNMPGPWWAYELLVLRRDAERALEIIGDGEDLS